MSHDDIDARGEDREACEAAARASSERDEIALRFAVAAYRAQDGPPLREYIAEYAYDMADAFLAERARRRAEGGGK